MKKELKIYYTADKITAIGFDLPDGTLDPVMIVNPLCKIHYTERNEMLVKMVNGYNARLVATEKIPAKKELPNFGDEKPKQLATHSDRSFSIGVPQDLFPLPEPIKKNRHAPEYGIAVDVGCQGNPGKTEFRGIDLATKKVVFHIHIPGDSTNNVGEYLAAVAGLQHCKTSFNSDYKCWSDSMTAISWVRQKKCKTNFVVTNKEQLEMIANAEAWLKKFGGTVSFWNKKVFGSEIIADFNRKAGAKGKRI